MIKEYHCALYARLSKEDGDKPESDSIINQISMLESYCEKHDLAITDRYCDDGYTGTNFNRPGFNKMLHDAQCGKISCIIVKDLSRFGRDYIDTGRYLERILPDMQIRFIAVTDSIDSDKGPYDMILPVKNIFNSQYAKDISRKIKSAFDTKRRQGQFIGAFCSYGYQKDPQDHNHLLIDDAAAAIVKRIFDLYEQGMGKDAIARKLNGENIACPSEYKHLIGENYHNGLRHEQTKYWTYSTIGRILSNRMYVGDMVQGKYVRACMHGKAHKQNEEEWIVAPNTHDAIISDAQWNRVQRLLELRAKKLDFKSDNPLSGFIKCGDCGHGMVRRGKGDKAYYSCGTYDRYGPQACGKHRTNKAELERIILNDLNSVILAAEGIKRFSKGETKPACNSKLSRLKSAIERVGKLRKGVYEDYKEGLLSKDEYLSYRADYEQKEKKLRAQLQKASSDYSDMQHNNWADEFIKLGKLYKLDRPTVAETIQRINVYEDGCVEINYRFSHELACLFEGKEA